MKLILTLLFLPSVAFAQVACPDSPSGEVPCIRFTCEVKLDRAYKVIDREDRQIERYRKLIRQLRAKARGRR